MKKILMVLCFLILITGCTSINENKEEENMVYIKPFSLFKGDAKILEPHLNLIGGAVKLSFKGKNKMISTKYEIWENGKLISSNELISSYINKDFDGQVSVSLKDDVMDEKVYEFISAIQDNGGYTSHKSKLDKLDKDTETGIRQLNEEVKVKLGKEVAIWSLVVNKANKNEYMTFGPNIEENAKKVDWAFVFKLVVKNKEI